jgi:hypothetical protein
LGGYCEIEKELPADVECNLRCEKFVSGKIRAGAKSVILVEK